MAEPALDIVAQVRQFNAGREPERLALKYAAMRHGAFPFLRATCHLFYDRLPADPVLTEAPAAWCCGDLHLENFGSYKGDNRLAYFDINDFDEAALAPLSWDVLRFVTSVLVGAKDMGLRKREARALCLAFLDAYATTLGGGKAGWIEAETTGGLVRSLLDDVAQRSRADFLDRRTERKGAQRRIRIDGKKALAAGSAERERAMTLLDTFARTQDKPAFFAPLDVARRIAGTGSLGLERYVVLVQGKGGADGNYLLDLKLAPASSLAPHLRRPQPAWATEAQRIVAAQCRMQAVSAAFLHALGDGQHSYVLRALLPSEDRVTLDRTKASMADFAAVVQTMGIVTARRTCAAPGAMARRLRTRWSISAAATNGARPCSASHSTAPSKSNATGPPIARPTTMASLPEIVFPAGIAYRVSCSHLQLSPVATAIEIGRLRHDNQDGPRVCEISSHPPPRGFLPPSKTP